MRCSTCTSQSRNRRPARQLPHGPVCCSSPRRNHLSLLLTSSVAFSHSRRLPTNQPTALSGCISSIMQPPKPDPTRTHPAASPSVSSDDVDLTSPANLRKLVLNYLLHHCYTDTAVAFAKDGIIGDLYASDLPARPAAASTSQASDSSSRVDTSTGSPPEPALRSTAATATTATNGAAARQAHPLSAPPLSRDDSSMEIEVENLLPTTSEHPAGHTDHTNGHSNGASRPDQSRAQDELADAELASDIDDATAHRPRRC